MTEQEILDILKTADLERGELNDLSLGQLFKLSDRGLVEWRADYGPTTFTTLDGRFPRHNNVRLTDLGLAVARRQQHKVINP